MTRILKLDDPTYYDIIDCIGFARIHIEETIEKDPKYAEANKRILEKIEDLKELFYNL